MNPIGYIEKDGKRQEIFREDQKRVGWTFVTDRIPAPDAIVPEVERRLWKEILEDIAKDPQWVARKIEIETEVRGE